MLNVNVYHPTPVISGPIVLINPHSTPNKKKKKKKKKKKLTKNQKLTTLQVHKAPTKILPTNHANF